MVSDLYSDRQNLEKSIAAMRGVEQDMRFRLRTMLETFLKQLEEAPRMTTEAPPQDDFADRAQAIKEAIAREETQVARRRRGASASAAAAAGLRRPTKPPTPPSASRDRSRRRAGPRRGRARTTCWRTSTAG